MAKITINGISIDPLAPSAALASADLVVTDASRSNYLLIQTTQPLNQDQKAIMAKMGVTILEYVPENTYLCRYLPADLTDIRSLPFVTWANIYITGFKISPNLALKGTGNKFSTLSEIVAKPGQSFSDMPKTVDVVFHSDVNPETVREKIATAAQLDPADLKLSRHKVRITVQTKHLADLAAIDEVRHIEEVVPRKLHCNIARQIIKAGIPVYQYLYEGEGQIVVVADSGFDKGSTIDVHPAFQNRVVKLYALGRSNNANDPHGHGTHVAGSVLGNAVSGTLGINIRGIAPQSLLIFQSLMDGQGGLGGIPDDLDDLFLPPYQQYGARIHTNSWGSLIGDSKYDTQAYEIDDFVWNHRDFVICFSAGNEGKDYQATGRIASGSITPPATAKNCITVGASENYRPAIPLTYGNGWPEDFPGEPIYSDQVANNIHGIAAFSSRGPTQDHRIKPDVVAPGTFILSTLSRSVTAANPGWQRSADPLYYFQGGTSFAVPLVAGCVAVIREFLWKQLRISSPSAALIKALIINGARDVDGQYTPSEADRIPNTAEGFGLVDLAAVIGPFSAYENLLYKEEATLLDTGQEEYTTIAIAERVAMLKVTLVWTDPPGENLQNDLDLIIRTASGAERHGNMPLSSTDFDRINNVEQVIWQNVPSGRIDIIVRAYRIVELQQSYSLVIRILYF